MSDARTIWVPIVLMVQGILVLWASQAEMRPTPPKPESFPAAFGEWRRIAVMASLASGPSALNSGALLDWLFVRQSGVSSTGVNLFVAWYPSQRDADPFIHRPDVCLPGNGWKIESTNKVKIEAVPDTISAMRNVISKGYDREVVFYWYQTHHRMAADLWELKLGMMIDGFRERRSDIALVRLVIRCDLDTESAGKLGFDFARAVSPRLREWWPQ